jgi:hypothetical protein
MLHSRAETRGHIIRLEQSSEVGLRAAIRLQQAPEQYRSRGHPGCRFTAGAEERHSIQLLSREQFDIARRRAG